MVSIILLFLMFAALGLLLFNIITMVVSPRFWFDLPHYLAFRGTIRRSLLATWHGQLQIRAMGVVALIVVSPIVRDFVRDFILRDRPLQQPPQQQHQVDQIRTGG